MFESDAESTQISFINCRGVVFCVVKAHLILEINSIISVMFLFSKFEYTLALCAHIPAKSGFLCVGVQSKSNLGRLTFCDIIISITHNSMSLLTHTMPQLVTRKRS